MASLPLSIGAYADAIICNGVIFLVATVAGQLALTRHYRALIANDPRHRVGRACWLLLYVFVAIQLAWVLRPFVGAPTIETRFLRENAWSNAYVQVFEAIARMFAG